MILVLIRHGKAEPKKPGMPDSERALTEEGKKDVTLLASTIPPTPDVIFTSPYKRAVETAQIIAKEFGGVLVKVDWRLEPEAASVDSLREMSLYKYSTVFIAGHAPSLDEIGRYLIGGGNFRLPAGGALGIEIKELDYGKGLLKFLVTPDVARKCQR